MDRTGRVRVRDIHDSEEAAAPGPAGRYRRCLGVDEIPAIVGNPDVAGPLALEAGDAPEQGPDVLIPLVVVQATPYLVSEPAEVKSAPSPAK